MSHLKTLAAPKTWQIHRKERIFTVHPSPSSHPREFILPLQVVMRDILGMVHTARELRYTIHHTDILLDGKKQQDVKRGVGLMDVLSFPALNKYYRLLINTKGKLHLKEIDQKESMIKVCKVIRKSHVRKGKTQLGLHDGRTLLGDEKTKVGSSVVLALPKCNITGTLELKEGVYITLIRGKHAGSYGKVREIKAEKVIYEEGDKIVETLKEYAFVIGEDKPLVTL